MDPKNKSQVGGAQPGVPTDKAASAAFDEELKQLWDWNLTTHKVTAEGQRKIEALRSTAIAMKEAIIGLSPHSRERSIALTNLEQVVFYSVAAIARTEVEEDQAAADDKPEEDKALEAEQADQAGSEDKPKDGEAE